MISSLEGLEGVFVLIVRFSLISPKANGTWNVFISVTFFFGLVYSIPSSMSFSSFDFKNFTTNCIPI